MFANPGRGSRWRKRPLALLEIREGVQYREGKGIQRRAIGAMPIGENVRRRLWHGWTLCATNPAIEVLCQAAQILWGGLEEDGGIDGVPFKKHQVLLRCDDNGLVNPRGDEQEAASALGRLGMPLLPKLARELGLVMAVVENQKRARTCQTTHRRHRAGIGVILQFPFQVEIEDGVRSLLGRGGHSEGKRCLPDGGHIDAAGPTMGLQTGQQFSIGSKGRYCSVEIILPRRKWVACAWKMEKRKGVINRHKWPTASRRCDGTKHNWQRIMRPIADGLQIRRLAGASGDVLGFVIPRQEEIRQPALSPSFAPLKETAEVRVIQAVATAHVNPRPVEPERPEQLL